MLHTRHRIFRQLAFSSSKCFGPYEKFVVPMTPDKTKKLDEEAARKKLSAKAISPPAIKLQALAALPSRTQPK